MDGWEHFYDEDKDLRLPMRIGWLGLECRYRYRLEQEA